jgi:hypothetical protein
MFLNLSLWIHGLVSAFIGGGASVVAAAFVIPDKVQLTDLNTVWKLWLVSGVMSAITYLAKSPLPAIREAIAEKKAMLGVIALAFGLCFGIGCTNLQQNQALNITAEIVSKDATYFALRDNPDLRGDFERALVELNAIAIADSIKFDDVVALVLRLPVEQLKSAEAQIIASDVAIIVKGFAPNEGEIISPENLDRIRAFVVALRDGVKRGLSQSQL